MLNKGLVLLIIGLFVIIFISACEPVPEPAPPPVTCDKPYILFEGACCLDANNNYVCDDKEPSKPEVSLETVSGSNDGTEVICPKDLTYPFGYDPNSQVEIKFTAKYTDFGSTNYATGLECDDGYTASTNPIRVNLENNQSQIIKSKITTSPKICTFKLVETQNVNNVVSCNVTVKPFGY